MRAILTALLLITGLAVTVAPPTYAASSASSGAATATSGPVTTIKVVRPVTRAGTPAPGWRVATGLEQVGENRFAAADYDELADCPIECGDFLESTFTAGRRTHKIVVSGSGEFDLKQLTRDTKRIVETELAFWGGAPPYETYTFICHVYPGARGGLEHRNSTVLGIDSFKFHPRKDYEEEVLSLIAHR